MPGAHTARAIDHIFDPALRAGFVIGFCILFAFIGTFTYINFELVKPPLGLGMMELGVIYFVFLPSIVTTPLAGRAVSAVGVRPSLWGGLGVAAIGLPLLLQPRLGPVLTGMVLVAAGTFFAQAVATGFVSRAATHNRSAASGIYLASYFLGGLVGSAVLGRLYEDIGWAACVAGIGVALIVAAIFCGKLRIKWESRYRLTAPARRNTRWSRVHINLRRTNAKESACINKRLSMSVSGDRVTCCRADPA